MKMYAAATFFACALTMACTSPVESAGAAKTANDSTGVEQASSPITGDEVDYSSWTESQTGARQEDSWSEFIALQTVADQEFLEHLDHRYFGVLSYTSAEEREYMVRAGFPTPEEWLSARRKTDTELEEAANAGDPKAAGMLADRMSVRLEELLELAKSDPGAVTDADRVRVATVAVLYASQSMDRSRSPFGLYVEGMVKSSIHDSWEPMTAAMIEATRRGDPRVERLVKELHARHPLQDIEGIHVSLRSMTRNNP